MMAISSKEGVFGSDLEPESLEQSQPSGFFEIFEFSVILTAHNWAS